MKLGDVGTATVPGVGRVNVLNLGTWVSLALGMFVIALTWSFATQYATKAKATISGYIPGARPAEAASADPIYGYM